MKTPTTILVLCALALPWHGLRAQEPPPATTEPSQSVTAPATTGQTRPTRPLTHHTRHHRRRHGVHLQPQAAAPVEAPAPVQAGSPGTAPAPMPNEDIGPPRPAASNDTSVDPGNLSIHYPSLGNGYVPGSSPQDMENNQTPKVPGVTVKVPLEQPRPETLPAPEAH